MSILLALLMTNWRPFCRWSTPLCSQVILGNGKPSAWHCKVMLLSIMAIIFAPIVMVMLRLMIYSNCPGTVRIFGGLGAEIKQNGCYEKLMIGYPVLIGKIKSLINKQEY